MNTNEENNAIQLFADKKIRTAWDAEREEWYFSVTDIVSALTDSSDPKQYIKKMRSRDPELNARWGTLCTLTAMVAADGKTYKTGAANLKGILRIIQSIPSPKTEPLKLWLAQVGSERVAETIDPELTIERALETYFRKGYSREWINQRLQAIQVRKELTDEWQDRGVQKGREYAILTDEITRAWAGLTTRQYKTLKGLKKETSACNGNHDSPLRFQRSVLWFLSLANINLSFQVYAGCPHTSPCMVSRSGLIPSSSRSFAMPVILILHPLSGSLFRSLLSCHTRS